MIAFSKFQDYLQSICFCSDYKQWWAHGVLTDTEREQSEPFEFDLHLKEVGIPVEMARRLYEVVQERHNQP
jgi:hypothetical protein